jgi:hypothetical protein
MQSCVCNRKDLTLNSSTYGIRTYSTIFFNSKQQLPLIQKSSRPVVRCSGVIIYYTKAHSMYIMDPLGISRDLFKY